VAGYQRELTAQKSGVSLATVRREGEKAIDQRRLDAPDCCVRLQVTRLRKRCAWSMMPSLCGLKAVEPLVKIVGMLDRYHDGGCRRDEQTGDRAASPTPSRRSR
jgi:hypothetical protein